LVAAKEKIMGTLAALRTAYILVLIDFFLLLGAHKQGLLCSQECHALFFGHRCADTVARPAAPFY
jgi:hypothetical protein